MIKTIVLDNNQETKSLISSYLNNIDEIELLGIFDDFNSINDIKDIDLIIFDINSSNADNIILKIIEFKNKYKNLDFIATSYEINSELVSKTLKYNVREFLLKPIIPNLLENAILKIKDIKNNSFKQRAKTICVFSNKGGVGKTSLAVNLGYEIAQNLEDNNKVCILDLSFNSEDIATFLNIEPKYNINNILSNLENADEKTLLSFIDKYKNTRLYTLALNNNFSAAKNYNTQTILKIINALKNIFSYIIIDTTSIIDETMVSILNNSDLVLLIALMNLASIRNCQKCYELFENINPNKDKYKLIVNRYIENTQISIKDLEHTLSTEVFYKIPNNYLTLIDAINLGQTLGEINPQSNIAKAYKNLAEIITNIDFLSLNNINSKARNYGIFNTLRRMGE